MSEFNYDEPVVESSKICVGIAGATGTGKTWSAMEVMVGLVGDGNFAVLDTEQGRAIHYHKKRLGKSGFDFKHALFQPPYSPARYKAGIAAAAKQGIQGLIIDSGSHMWESEGGVQDMVEKRTLDLMKRYKADREKVQFSAWQQPKAEAWDMIQYAKKCGLHVIICFRAKNKSKMEKVAKRDGGFKTEIIPIGWQPITDAQLPYEMDFIATLDPERPGVPMFTYKALAKQFHDVFKDGDQLSRKHGSQLLEWCNSGIDTKSDDVPAKTAKVTISAPDGRTKDVATDKAVDLLLKSMGKCESEQEVWDYINANSDAINKVSPDDKERFDTAAAELLETIKSRAVEYA